MQKSSTKCRTLLCQVVAGAFVGMTRPLASHGPIAIASLLSGTSNIPISSEPVFAMSSEIVFDNAGLAQALALAGKDEDLRTTLFEALRRAEAASTDPAAFREQVRWPLILASLSEAGTHKVKMGN